METIVTRIKQLISNNGFTTSSFAAKIDVDRGALTHVLSGRNKPSLAIIKAIVDSFDTVSFDWLIYGDNSRKETAIELNFETQKTSTNVSSQAPSTDLVEKSTANMVPSDIKMKASPTPTVTKVILIYSDGSIDVKE